MASVRSGSLFILIIEKSGTAGQSFLSQRQKNHPAGWFLFLMAGMKGFEPLHGGFRVHSLTAWLHPNLACSYILRFSIKKSTRNFKFSGKSAPDGFAPLTPQACTPRMQDILACSVSDRIKTQSRFFPSFNLCGYTLSMNRFISQFSKMKTGRKIDFRCPPPPFLKPGIRL